MNTNTSPSPATENPSPVPHKVLMEWSAPRSHFHERSQRWYTAGAVVVLAVSAYGILFGVWSLTITTLLIGGIYFLLRKEPPSLHTLRIEETGIQYDDEFIHWNDLEEAWFVKAAPDTKLYFRRKHGTPRELSLYCPRISITDLRAVLSHFMTVGSDRPEHLLDLFIRLCRL